MIFRWDRIEKLLNYLLVFLLPTQLALHFWPQSAFVFGTRVDYLAPTVYLTDLLFIILFVSWIKKESQKILGFIQKNKKILLFLLLVAIFNIGFSTSIYPSLYKWLKIIELGAFCYYVRERKDIFFSKILLLTLFYSLLFFSLIGVTQFLLSGTIGGPLYLLGERNFNITTPGIALTEVMGRNFMRAYSTFSHPNSFAGYLGLGIITLFFNLSKKELKGKTFGLIIILIAFILTFSLSATIGMVFAVFLFSITKLKLFKERYFLYIPGLLLLISLSFPFVSKLILQSKVSLPQSVEQRMELSLVAGNVISRKFILGEGLNTFVITEPKMGLMGKHLWVLQPVHNLFLLVFSEIGVVGLLLFYILLVKLIQGSIVSKNVFLLVAVVFILTTGLLDHYWFTLQQNMLLAVFILANFFGAKSKFYGTLSS